MGTSDKQGSLSTVTLSSFGSVEMSLHSGMMFALVIPESEPDSYCSGSDKPLKPFGEGLAVLETASSAIQCATYLLFFLAVVTSLWQIMESKTRPLISFKMVEVITVNLNTGFRK